MQHFKLEQKWSYMNDKLAQKNGDNKVVYSDFI